MPGVDYAEATRVVLGEIDDLPFVVELPARGPTASMTGRTLALVTGLAFDLQPAGWRLAGSPGIDDRRATSMLAQDLDTAEELGRDRRVPYKIQVAGPWTLAATVERPRGDKVLADHGARRDLAQALAEAMRVHCGDIVRRLDPTELLVQIDEPALPSVLAGAVPTASGFHRHRSITAAGAAEALTWIAEAVTESGGVPVVHCCAPDLPFDVLRSVPIKAVSFNVSLLEPTRYDDLGRWLDLGREAWLGVVPTAEPAGDPPSEVDVTARVLTGGATSDTRTSSRYRPPPSHRPVGWPVPRRHGPRRRSPLCQRVARNLSVEQGKIDP